MEPYSTITRNETLIHAKTWMNLETHCMLSKQCHFYKATYCIIAFI